MGKHYVDSNLWLNNVSLVTICFFTDFPTSGTRFASIRKQNESSIHTIRKVLIFAREKSVWIYVNRKIQCTSINDLYKKLLP